MFLALLTEVANENRGPAAGDGLWSTEKIESLVIGPAAVHTDGIKAPATQQCGQQ